MFQSAARDHAVRALDDSLAALGGPAEEDRVLALRGARVRREEVVAVGERDAVDEAVWLRHAQRHAQWWGGLGNFAVDPAAGRSARLRLVRRRERERIRGELAVAALWSPVQHDLCGLAHALAALDRSAGRTVERHVCGRAALKECLPHVLGQRCGAQHLAGLQERQGGIGTAGEDCEPRQVNGQAEQPR
eukprot:3639759-Prymnesium_polylepis.1